MPDELRRASDGQAMTCARCDVSIKLAFGVPLNEIPHLIHENEYTTLGDFPVVLYCPQCGHHTESTGRNLTIDREKMVVMHCEIDPVPGDMTPPDYVPDDLI
jgi:hypothetical protein